MGPDSVSSNPKWLTGEEDVSVLARCFGSYRERLMSKCRRWGLLFCPLCLGLLSVANAFGAEPKVYLVAPTEPLSPAEQQKQFHLPPGFEIQLIASEPEVPKPINLSFDPQGRLLVSQSIEY